MEGVTLRRRPPAVFTFNGNKETTSGWKSARIPFNLSACQASEN
jgi:hypothetical protein